MIGLPARLCRVDASELLCDLRPNGRRLGICQVDDGEQQLLLLADVPGGRHVERRSRVKSEAKTKQKLTEAKGWRAKKVRGARGGEDGWRWVKAR